MREWFKGLMVAAVSAVVLIAVIGLATVMFSPRSATAAAGDVTPANASFFVMPVTTLTCAEGAVITPTGSFYSISTSAVGATGGADVTVANPTATGQMLHIAMTAACTNTLGFTDGANLKLAGAYLMTSYDTLTIMAQTTTNWVEVCRSVN